jgi:hypothetical protein
MLLAAFLFAFHAAVIMETARFLDRIFPHIIEIIGKRAADPVLVFSAFAVLFSTHMLEGVAWAVFFVRIGEFKDLQTATYFTGTSLTTLGYGDVIIRKPWQRLGPILAANGILLYGCSTAFLFLIVQKVWAAP